VARIDHDFGSKNHFMASYRYYKINVAGTEQVDIGGFFPGDKLGTPASISSDPVQDWYLVAGLTTNVSSNTTNDLHYSWLRNWWAWTVPELRRRSLGWVARSNWIAASRRPRTWAVQREQSANPPAFLDGHDQMLRDDISTLKGNHCSSLAVPISTTGLPST